MLRTTSQNYTDDNDEKRTRGRPRVPHRAILEKGKYDTRPTDPEYFKSYYIEKLQGVKVPCLNCGVPVFNYDGKTYEISQM